MTMAHSRLLYCVLLASLLLCSGASQSADATVDAAEDDDIMAELLAEQKSLEEEKRRQQQRQAESEQRPESEAKEASDDVGGEVDVVLRVQTQFGIDAALRMGEDAAASTVRLAEKLNQGGSSIERHIDPLIDLAKFIGEKAPPEFSPPSELKLRTAGAHKRRAKEHRASGDHDAEAADVLRALMRPGLDIDIINQLRTLFNAAMQSLPQQRKQEAKEEADAAKVEARTKMEEEALAEALERRARDDEDWRVIEARVFNGLELHGDAEIPGAVIAETAITVVAEGEEEEIMILQLREGYTPEEALFHFFIANRLFSPDEIRAVSDQLDWKLRSLGIEVFPSDSYEESMAAVAKARKEGNVQGVGQSFLFFIHLS